MLRVAAKASSTSSEEVDDATLETCPICLTDMMTHAVSLPQCGHRMCFTCVMSYVRHAFIHNRVMISCPMCRQDILDYVPIHTPVSARALSASPPIQHPDVDVGPVEPSTNVTTTSLTIILPQNQAPSIAGGMTTNQGVMPPARLEERHLERHLPIHRIDNILCTSAMCIMNFMCAGWLLHLM